jgi:hypothetical protein
VLLPRCGIRIVGVADKRPGDQHLDVIAGEKSTTNAPRSSGVYFASSTIFSLIGVEAIPLLPLNFHRQAFAPAG